MNKVDNKGNWEFSFFQKKHDPNVESNIKLSLKPANSFNPKYIHQYINPEISKEEQYLQKKLSGQTLKTTENIILQNYLDKKAKAIENDILALKTQGLACQPITKEGKTRLLLKVLESQFAPSKEVNKISIANIYLRLLEDTFELTDNIKEEYKVAINKMNNIVKDMDLVELQFTNFHSQMPPLNQKGFVKFDDWQIKVVNNIDNNLSTIVNAPTSAGKSVLSGYVITKGKALFVVPTDALAWQMSSYIGHLISANVPIITNTFQSNPSREALIALLNNAPAIVGTSDCILDYLPFIENNFKWIVFDEIHMLGKLEGRAMESIARVLNNVPMLGLSATVGNTDELVEKFSTIKNTKVDKVICDKRFFNLQRYYYDSKLDELICIHPLSLVNVNQFEDRTILKKSLQPTPPNIWDLAIKLKDKLDLGLLDPKLYFNDLSKRIELDEANEYFNKLLVFMVENYKNNKDIIDTIINNYKHDELKSSDVDLFNLINKLKQDSKMPAIIFNKNTVKCLKMVCDFAKKVDKMESDKYPRLIQDRLKMAKLAKRLDKETESNSNSDKSKKEQKQFMGDIKLKKDKYNESSVKLPENQQIEVTSIQEPHPDFTFNTSQYFTESTVKEWYNLLGKYFPSNGDFYHFIIILLWRGVGVYTKGLPDPYLRLVQTLACNKQLAVVFSDESLVFGVSMPFRTVVVLNDDEDLLDSMLFHQMSGRAGRRGLDKEGNIVFAGFNWNRIKELSISEMPIVNSYNQNLYTIQHANKISEINNNNINWNNLISDSDFYNDITSNYKHSWNFSYIKNDINHLHMNWKLRYSNNENAPTNIILSFLIPYLRRGFENKNCTQENNQIEVAHFLSRFLLTHEANKIENKLVDPNILSENPYNLILDQLNDLQLDLPINIDNRIYLSIQNNVLVKGSNYIETEELRNRLFEFGEVIRHLQHYCFHSKIVGLAKLLGKLLTRIWWIYHNSSLEQY